MRTIDLGECCTDCVMAVEYGDSPAIGELMAAEGLRSLHTGEEQGFSWSPCDLCGSTLAGDRHSLYGLAR